MTLAPGVRLGAYEIVGLIGAGGMGEVYRARDTRLGRDVAVKIIPDRTAADPQFRDRFEREAHAISSLDHPNICALFDVGEHNGTAFLVMQYLEGETLEHRLRAGALPIDQALRCGIEIARALAAAHRAGIVHRDLKPANIMMTKSGARLLDFGLAKATGAGVVSSLSMAPTTPPITGAGTILGTFQYMAPEQLEGAEADARTDIFAFGAVLYEMLTGRRAFEGKSQASLISAIMTASPVPVANLGTSAPQDLDRVIEKCLAKDPDRRWQSAQDLADELSWVAERSPAVPSTATPSRAATRRLWVAAAAIGAFALGAASWFAFTSMRPHTAAGPVVMFAANLPDGWIVAPSQTTGRSTAPVAISPDGRRLAIVGRGPERQTQLWVRDLSSMAPVALPNTSGAISPFWSPDSRYIGFFAEGSLKRIEATGGPAVTLCATTEIMGGAWNRDGVIVFSPGAGTLMKVPATGGTATPATTLTGGETLHWRPSLLPDGRRFIYRANTPGQKGPFYVGSLDSQDRTMILNADASNILFASGHLLFMSGATLMAQPFDERRLVLTGEPRPTAAEVRTQSTTSVPNAVFSVSANGVLAYQPGRSSAVSELVWFDRAGKPLAKLGDPAAYSDVEISPDDRRVAVAVRDPAARALDLWIFDIARNVRTRLTSDPDSESGARWSHDGRTIVYQIAKKGMYLRSSGGVGAERQILALSHNEYPDGWTPDDRSIVYEMDDPKTSWDLWTLPLTPGAKPEPIVQAPFRQEYASLSNDGRWLAYQSDESGQAEIYVVSYPRPGDKFQVSLKGGQYPRWRHDGNELFYLSLDNSVKAVAVNGTGSTFQVGAEKHLFETDILRGNWPYDATSDGQRFLVAGAIEQSTAAPVTVVVNWTAMK